ncbi:uncharacterized protein EI90DRAFT_3063770 [Cantharellus anzutake]|uniref:uncharacterized protein n=1 Tax=Cantharellus anzutake TaxID=1750568 RepID=UPI00190400C6|nr:uncharacterized protein EI90DRAFT_3063770 [Cantharellus anzutake]KAF8328846.1 hypothetical protein EI90DRAFT_3063770 [Cantharellus anzutake]
MNKLPNLKSLTVSINSELRSNHSIYWANPLRRLHLVSDVYGYIFDCSSVALRGAVNGLREIDVANAHASTQLLEALIDGGREVIEGLKLPLSPISPYPSEGFLSKLYCPKLKRLEFRTRQKLDMRPFLRNNPGITRFACSGNIAEPLSACPSAESVVFMDQTREVKCIDTLCNLPNLDKLRHLQLRISDGPVLHASFSECLRSLSSLEYLSCSGQLFVHDCDNSGEHYAPLHPDGNPTMLTEEYSCGFPSLKFVEVVGFPFRFISLPPPPVVEPSGQLAGDSNLLRWRYGDEYASTLPPPWANAVRSLIGEQTRQFLNRAPKFQRARFRPYTHPPYDLNLDVIVEHYPNRSYFVLGGFGRKSKGEVLEGDGGLFAQIPYDGPWTTSWKSGPFCL